MQQHIHMHAFADINKSTLTYTHVPHKMCKSNGLSCIGGIAMFQMSFCFYFSHSFFFLLTCFVFGCCSCTSSSLLSSNSKRETAKLSILKRKNREGKCWNFKQFYMNAVKLQKCVFLSPSLSVCRVFASVHFSFFFFAAWSLLKVIFLHINYTWHDTFCWHRNLFSKVFGCDGRDKTVFVFNSISGNANRKTVTTKICGSAIKSSGAQWSAVTSNMNSEFGIIFMV